jgi:hypothetical protein
MTTSPAVSATLKKMESSDTTARMMAISEAGTLLVRGEEGALEPFIAAAKDDDMMVRMTALNLLSRMTSDPSMKPVVISAVSAEGDDSPFVEAIKTIAESGAMEADDAQAILTHIGT